LPKNQYLCKMRIFYLGDIHGNFNVIHQYVKQFSITDAHIIQVGDFGVGFMTVEKERRLLGMYHDILVKNNVTVWAIRGNHDYKPHFDSDPFGFSNIRLIPDYTTLELGGKRIFCVGGAVSVDREWRYTDAQRKGDFDVKPGQTWWKDEIFVLDKEKAAAARDIDIVVTHTCPSYCPPDNTFGFGPFVEGIIRETGDVGLKTDLMVERHQVDELFHLLKLNGNDIKKHYYGHFHKNDIQNYDGVAHRMLGVGELWEERDEV
jgi:predicted phosphodiesterase